MKEPNAIKWIRRGLILSALALAYGFSRVANEAAATVFIYYNLLLLGLVALHYARQH